MKSDASNAAAAPANDTFQTTIMAVHEAKHHTEHALVYDKNFEKLALKEGDRIQIAPTAGTPIHATYIADAKNGFKGSGPKLAKLNIRDQPFLHLIRPHAPAEPQSSEPQSSKPQSQKTHAKAAGADSKAASDIALEGFKKGESIRLTAIRTPSGTTAAKSKPQASR